MAEARCSVSKSFGAKKPSKLLLFVQSTIDVLCALTFSPISPHQFCTQFNALCIKSQILLRNSQIPPQNPVPNSCSSPTNSADYRPPNSLLWTTTSHTHMHFNSPDINKTLYGLSTMIARRVIHRFKRCVVIGSLDIQLL
jgi:hypothetical protein